MQTEMSHPLQLIERIIPKEIVTEYRWIHLTLGLLGNLLFFLGSIMFLFEGRIQTFGVWTFVLGSFLMLVGSVGEAVVTYDQNTSSG